MKMFSLPTLALLTLALTAQVALAGIGTPATPLPLLVEQRLNNSALSAPIVKLGTQVTQKKVNVLKAVYDFAVLGGASGSSIILKDAAGGDAVLPKNAIIKQVLISTPTTLVGTGATLSFGFNHTADNLKADTAITTYNTAPQFVAGIPVGTAATMLKGYAYNFTVGMNIEVAPITAGKVLVYIEYYLQNE